MGIRVFGNIFGVLALLSGSSSVVAAQTYVSAWDGFYAGASVGLRSSDTNLNTVDFGGAAPPVPGVTSQSFSGNSVRGGIYGGYNWQFAPRWIAGVEGDVGSADKTKAQYGFLPGFSGVIFPLFAGDNISVQLTWDASLRARLGYAITPSLLVYGTGGVAWQHLTTTSNCGALCGVVSGSDSRTVTGYTVGGGLEAPLGGNWLARGEYRYSDYGTIRQPINYPAPLSATANIDTTLRTHLMSIGIAYRFGSEKIASGATLAAPQPSYNWTGFRAGLSAGARVTSADWTTMAFTGFVVPAEFATESFDRTAFRGGFFGGFDWQFAPRWIAGFEADFSPSTAETAQNGFLPGASGILFLINPGDNVTVTTKADYSLRARLGFLATPALLAYVTAGKAWQQLEFSATCGAGTCGPNASTASASATTAAWTFGGGLENRINDNLLVRAEYRYTDFGTVPVHLSDYPFVGFSADANVALKTHTVLVGVALAFN